MILTRISPIILKKSSPKSSLLIFALSSILYSNLNGKSPSAYSSFATNGILAPPYLIERIEDSKGELIYRHITSQRVSIPDPAAAVAVRKTLELAAQYGTGTRAVLDDREIAGKTGTHQGFREAWFIGFIPQYTSSVWIGFAEEQLPLTDVEINGEIVSNVSGGRVPAPIWKEFMEKVVEDLPIEEWPNDPIEIDRYYEIPKVEIPDLLGLNVLDGEEIAFSNYILPIINLVDSEETPGLILSQNVDNCDRDNKSDNTEDESNDECIGIEMPEGTVVNLEVSGNKFSSAIPNIPPCTLSLEEGQSITVKWRGKPVFIKKRTKEEIEAAKMVQASDLRDPQDDADRVQKEEWLVLVGVCTHLGCVPLGQKLSDMKGDYDGWFCPCHGSHYDTSGRIRKGPAPTNLDVPPYSFLNDTTIKIG